MKKLLKLTAVLTVIALLASCFAVFSVSAAVPTTTQETINEVKYDLYTVGTAQDLKDTVTAVNALDDTSKVIIRLSTDITLNTLAEGETWATKENATAWGGLAAFKGIFDGDGHTISGLYIKETENNCVGLIFKSYGCTVQNLTIDNSYVSGVGHVGAIIGSEDATATSATTVSNVKVTNTTVTGTSTYIGGLVGGAWKDLTISDCDVNATVNGSSTIVGGLIGGVGNKNTTNATIAISNSTVRGNITGTSNIVGGFVGQLYSNEVTITNSLTNANVSGAQKTGGFIGCIYSGTLSITNAVTMSTVSGGANKHVGGMVGCLNGSTSNIFTNCISAGALNATNAQAGMVVGYDWATSANFTDCYVLRTDSEVTSVKALAGSGGTFTLTINGSTSETTIATKTRDELAAIIKTMGNATGDAKYTLATEALAGLFGNDMVYAQIRESDNALRFVAPITGKDYKAVGMTITATYNGTGKSVTRNATTLYKTITETKDGATTHTTAVENEYFYCFVLTGAPEGVTFEITTFVTVDDGSAEGITYPTGTYTATYTAGTLK